MYNLNELRKKEFPISDNYIYFNHAGISPVPQRTVKKVQWAIAKLAENPALFWGNEGMETTARLKELACKLIGAHDPNEIVPVPTTSSSLNAVAQSIDWQPGDNVIFCEGEFPSNAYPWMNLAKEGVTVHQAPAEKGGATRNAIEPFVDKNTRLIAVSAIQFFSGHRADLAEIGRFCHEHNILFVVDAIQAIGHMPINVETMHIDVLATGGQKSLLGLPGAGFLYVRNAIAEQLHPRGINSNATQDFLHWLNYDLTPADGALRFNTGTPNLPGIFAAAESLGLLQELGVGNIDVHTTELTHQASRMLSEMGLNVITPQDACGPITTFRSPFSNEETDALIQTLSAEKIIVVKHLDAPGNPHIRLSFHCYNTPEEVERFGETFGKLVKQ